VPNREISRILIFFGTGRLNLPLYSIGCGQFPKLKNREFFARNREFGSPNREFWRIELGKCPALSKKDEAQAQHVLGGEIFQIARRHQSRNRDGAPTR